MSGGTSNVDRACGCGRGSVQTPGLVCRQCWEAAPGWMRQYVASKYPNQKREAREKLIAFAVGRRSVAQPPEGGTLAATSMLGFCAWCPELLGRDAVFVGSKAGEGVSHGICPECEGVFRERHLAGAGQFEEGVSAVKHTTS